ncbi:MAG: retropepsin-like aspartic protease family protein [Pikeienuella sp.]
MYFWPIAVVIALAIVVVQVSSSSPNAETYQNLSQKLMYLSALLLVVLIWGARQSEVRLRPAILALLLWSTALGALFVSYTHRDKARMVMDSLRGTVSPTIAVARQQGEVELKKAWDGHFRAVTKINGAKVGLLVDTGASLVLLTYLDAQSVGVDMSELSFTQPVVTANGRSHVAMIDLETVTVGGIGLYNVKAAVAEPGKLHSSLLGMSFLGRIQETSFRRDTLILRN